MDDAILMLLIGIGLTFLGYGPLSLKRNPAVGGSLAIVGYLFRLAGPLLVLFGLATLATMLLWNPP